MAENSFFEKGGNVVRLAGLYHAQRGAHKFFLKKGSVERDPNGVINLIHYEDAARMVKAVRTSLCMVSP